MPPTKEPKAPATVKKEENRGLGSQLLGHARKSSKHHNEKDKNKDKEEKEEKDKKTKPTEKEKDKKARPTYRISPTAKAASSQNLNDERHGDASRRMRSLSAIESVNFGDEPQSKTITATDEGIAPVLIDNSENRNVPIVGNNECYYNVDEERANIQLRAQQQYLQQQQLTSIARARFLAQQQQRLFQNAWMATSTGAINMNGNRMNSFCAERTRWNNQPPLPVPANGQLNGTTAPCTNARGAPNESTNNESGLLTSAGSNYSIVPTNLSPHNSRMVSLVEASNETESNGRNRESSFSEFVLNMYDMEDVVETKGEADPRCNKTTTLDGNTEEEKEERKRESNEDVGPSVIDVDVADDTNYLESSLFNLNANNGAEDEAVPRKATPTPPPPSAPVAEKKGAPAEVVVTPLYSRVMGLAVVVGQCDHYVVKDVHQISVKEENNVQFECSMDEALQRAPGARLNSILLQETSRQVVAGHRSALLALLGAGGGSACQAMLTTAVEGIMSTLSAKKDAVSTNTDFFYKVEMSLFIIQDEQEVRDLYNTPKGNFPIKGVANPIAGHWLDGLQLREIASVGGVAAAVEPCKAWLHDDSHRAGYEKEALGMFVVVRQVQQNHGNTLIHLSSLFSLVSKSGARMQQMCVRPASLSPSLRSLVRRIGHGTYTVAATFLTNEMTNGRQYLTQCRDLSAIHNSGLLSGNLDRYMKFAKIELAQAEELAAKSDPAMKGQLDSAVAVQRNITTQMECFTKNPKTSDVPFFADLVAEKEFASSTEPVGKESAPVPKTASPVTVPKPAPTPTTPARAPAAAAPSPKEPAPAVTKSAQVPQSKTTAAPSATAIAPDFADQRIHTVAIVDTADSGFTVVPPKPTTLVRKADGTTRELDEIVVKDKLPEDRDMPFSTQITKLAKTFANGTNCALFSYDGRTNNLFESPAWTALFEVVRMAVAKESQSRDLRLSVSLVKSKGEVTDLLRDGDVASPLTVASSPLFGPIVHNASMQKVQTEDNVRDLLFTVATNAAKLWSGECIMYVTLLNTFTVRTDVVVNSFMACISGSHSDIITSIMDQTVHPDVLALHRAALQGSSSCVVLLSLNNVDDSNKAVKLIDLCAPLKKDAPRTGSVSQFVHHTRASVEKRKAKIEATQDPVERKTMEKLNRRIENMMTDYEHLLYDPTGNFPQSYVMESAVPREARASSPTAQSKKSETPVSNAGGGGKHSTAAATSQPAAASRSNHPQLIVGIDTSGSVAPQLETSSKRIVWKPTKEVFEADEVLLLTASTKTKALCTSTLTQNMVQQVTEGRSVALVGIADSSVTSVSASEPVWPLFDHIVREGCFSSSTWTRESNVELRLLVLQDRTVMADFLDEEAIGITKQVQVAASTLFGPVVRNVKAIPVASAEEWEETLSTALGSMDLYFRQTRTSSPAIVIASVVRREVRDGDVTLSSVNTYSFRAGCDLPALRDVLSLDPQGFYPTSLFRYAFGGPCRMLCVASVVSDEKKVSELLQVAQRVCFLTSPSVPNGSVLAYLAYQEKRQASAGDTSPDDTKKHTQIIVNDMRDLIAHPGRELPIYWVEEPRANGGKKASSQGAVPIVGVAVATYGRDQDGDDFVVNTNTNTMINEGLTYTFDEVLSRADNSAVIRPSFFETLSRRFLDGFNQCLFVTDGAGSQVGPAIVSRVANIVLQNKRKEGLTLYLSVGALRFITPFGEIKDLIEQDSALRSSNGSVDLSYSQLNLAASPLFGICLGGITFSAVSDLGDLHVLLKNAQSACATDKASLIVSLVAKQTVPDENDVVLNSLFLVLTNAENTPANRRLPHMLGHVSSSANASLFSRALGGAAYTYSVVGVTAGQDKDRGELLDETAALMKVRVRVPKRSSAKAVLARAERILSHTSDDEDALAMGHYDWENVKEDIEMLLTSPQSETPKYYLMKRQ